MARASYRRAASALVAVGMAALVSSACASLGLADDPSAPAGRSRPAGEAQVITVELGQKDNRFDTAVRTKRPGEDLDLKDARPEVGRTPTPRTSDTAGTISTWENWPTPTPPPPGSGSSGASPDAAATGSGKQASGAAAPPPAKPVGAARPANARPPAAPTATPGEAASRKVTS